MKKLFLILIAGLFLINFVSAFDWGDNLDQYWALEDNNANTTVHAEVGTTGVLSGGNTEDKSVVARVNNGFDLDGTGDFVTITDGINVGADFSVNMWVNPDSITGQQNFFDMSGQVVQLIMSDGASDGKIRVLLDGVIDFKSTASMTAGAWNMITLVHDQGVSTKIYINSKVNGSATGSASGSTTQIKLGNYVGDQPLAGIIDEAGIWTRTLNQTEIDELYNGGIGLSYLAGSCLLEYNGTNSSISCNGSATTNYPTGIIDYGAANSILTVNYTSNSVNYEHNITLEPGENTLKIYYINATGVVKNMTNSTWSYKTFENSRTFNASTYETAYEGYSINLTANSSLTAVDLFYNGTYYSTTKSGTLWSYARDLPSSVNGTQIFNFRLTYAGSYINSINSTQGVNLIYFIACNGTYTNDFLNISFRDESNSSLINASISSSIFEYYLGSGTITKEYEYINNIKQFNFTFCASPTNRTFYVDPYVQYKQGTEYPQRIWDTGVQTYTNTSINQILYLLSSSDGIYVTFQVINTADQLISGVDLTAVRQIGGSDVTIANGKTSAAGAITFWLNPDFTHTFNFSKDGYDSYSYSDAPTQSSYTITLVSESQVQNDTFRGIGYSVYPTNTFLENNTVYTFGFYLTSSYWDVGDYGFNLRLANGTVITGGNTGTEGTNLTLNYNTTNQSIVYIDYYWTIAGNTTNATRYWIVQNTDYTGYSIKTFFTDLNSYLLTGIFGLDAFGRILIVFLIIFISSGILSYKYGMTNPLAVSSLTFSIVFFFDVVVNLIPDIRGISNLPTFISGVVLILTIINEVKNR
jgi:hypothetical protein